MAPDDTDPGTGTGPRPTGAPAQARRLDARSLRGLAHPLRMRILEHLTLDGPATSTTLARHLGENTGTVSWHLRHLAEHGFIEEDATRGTRRERWWKRAPTPHHLETADFRHDPHTRDALHVYLREILRRQHDRTAAYLAQDWPDTWRAAGTLADWTDLRLTPEQLTALNNDIADLVARHTPDPQATPDPDALPVVVQLQAFPRHPATPPAAAAATEPDPESREAP